MKLNELWNLNEAQLNEKIWSGAVHTKKHPPEDLFAEGSATDIVDWLKSSHKDKRSAMSALNFYINRAGKKLSAKRRAVLDVAKSKLSKESFGKKVKEALDEEGEQLNELIWSGSVHTKKHPPEGLFATGSADDIVKWLTSAHKDKRSAMSALNFYINRAGKNLSAARKGTLEAAKKKLSAE